MEYYLTEYLMIRDHKMYYQGKLVKQHNWQNALRDYGWEKIPKPWIRLLNKHLEKPRNNSLFGMLDCGENGDCLFHCISYALKDINDDTFDATHLRNVLSENITEDEYNTIIGNYQILHDSGDFDETWNPHEVTYTTFKNDIIKNETEYWGDIHLLILLKKYLGINCVILYSNDMMNTYYHYPLSDTYDPELKTILLLYENEIHFKLVGYFMNGTMVVSFTNDTLPHEIFKMINYDK
jgi:hypothetical protein